VDNTSYVYPWSDLFDVYAYATGKQGLERRFPIIIIIIIIIVVVVVVVYFTVLLFHYVVGRVSV
jgi:hypothetical protein